ncbi:hypothetical protein BU17DRAFT_103157 [Hysterangium stoloniferum]|nr:hypothetical protein BU17DRAFT_103157 [Hysterangium stoloniferum]
MPPPTAHPHLGERAPPKSLPIRAQPLPRTLRHHAADSAHWERPSSPDAHAPRRHAYAAGADYAGDEGEGAAWCVRAVEGVIDIVGEEVSLLQVKKDRGKVEVLWTEDKSMSSSWGVSCGVGLVKEGESQRLRHHLAPSTEIAMNPLFQQQQQLGREQEQGPGQISRCPTDRTKYERTDMVSKNESVPPSTTSAISTSTTTKVPAIPASAIMSMPIPPTMMPLIPAQVQAYQMYCPAYFQPYALYKRQTQAQARTSATTSSRPKPATTAVPSFSVPLSAQPREIGIGAAPYYPSSGVASAPGTSWRAYMRGRNADSEAKGKGKDSAIGNRAEVHEEQEATEARATMAATKFSGEADAATKLPVANKVVASSAGNTLAESPSVTNDIDEALPPGSSWLRFRVIAQGFTVAAAVIGGWQIAQDRKAARQQGITPTTEEEQKMEKEAEERRRFEARMKEAEEAHRLETGGKAV